MEQHHELVTREPGHGVDLPDPAGDRLTHPPQGVVAREVPELVVDGLQAVEVEEGEQEARPLTVGDRQQSLGRGREAAAAEQSRERVVVDEVLELGTLALDCSRRRPAR